jgi:hypothetical protein
MAQGDTWINIGLAAGTGTPEKLKHNLVGGASGAGDASFIYDRVKLNNNLNLLDVILAQIRAAAIGSGFK